MKSEIAILLKKNDNISELHDFISTNNLTNDQLEPYLDLLVKYINSYNLCKKREDISKCSQDIKGYRYKLVLLSNKKITLILTDCLHSINNNDKEQVLNNFWIRYYDDELLLLSWSKNFISGDTARQQIAQYVNVSLKQKSYQGLYLHGEPGTGKTYIFILFANKLIYKNQTICFIVWADFIMDIKKSFKDDSNYYDKIEQLKTCDVLFIDDLGGETISAWERDEILFSILNARVLPLKTTFINSNYSINELSKHYQLRTIKSEQIKVKRLIERIQTLTSPIQLTTKNLGESLATDTNKNLLTNEK